MKSKKVLRSIIELGNIVSMCKVSCDELIKRFEGEKANVMIVDDPIIQSYNECIINHKAKVNDYNFLSIAERNSDLGKKMRDEIKTIKEYIEGYHQLTKSKTVVAYKLSPGGPENELVVTNVNESESQNDKVSELKKEIDVKSGLINELEFEVEDQKTNLDEVQIEFVTFLELNNFEIVSGSKGFYWRHKDYSLIRLWFNNVRPSRLHFGLLNECDDKTNIIASFDTNYIFSVTQLYLSMTGYFLSRRNISLFSFSEIETFCSEYAKALNDLLKKDITE